jgi:hypothetical protein
MWSAEVAKAVPPNAAVVRPAPRTAARLSPSTRTTGADRPGREQRAGQGADGHDQAGAGCAPAQLERHEEGPECLLDVPGDVGAEAGRGQPADDRAAQHGGQRPERAAEDDRRDPVAGPGLGEDQQVVRDIREGQERRHDERQPHVHRTEKPAQGGPATKPTPKAAPTRPYAPGRPPAG